jgi:hypothetical protein
MAKYRPIVFDWIAEGRPSLEDRVRVIVRENPGTVAPVVPTTSPLAAASAGFKAGRGATRIKGGTFSPGPMSGML